MSLEEAGMRRLRSTVNWKFVLGKRKVRKGVWFNFRIHAGRCGVCCLPRCYPAQCDDTYLDLRALICAYHLIYYGNRGIRILWNITFFCYVIRRHIWNNSDLQDNFVFCCLMRGWVSKAECERFRLDSSNRETNLSWKVPFIVPIFGWILIFSV